MKLYVEGGGDTAKLKSDCREGFRKFVEKAGIHGNMPRIIACGSRKNAYDSFCIALMSGDKALLLVDSETPVDPKHSTGEPQNWQPWKHLQERPGDGWAKPPKAEYNHCHLMVQCMEHWLVTDIAELDQFFGHGFKPGTLAKASKIESIAKDVLLRALATATKDCKTKSGYAKGEHSFKLLAAINPAKTIAASPWAKRFVDQLKIIVAAS